MTRPVTVPRGLYVITPQSLCSDGSALRAAAQAALAGGAVMLQYRDKCSTPEQQRRNAVALQRLCAAAGAHFIVNDSLALASDCGADGVHLGASDGSIMHARQCLGGDAIIGASCGPLLQRVDDAERAGASYAAIGRFHASRTKPDAPQATLADLHAARAAVSLPLCAIGGILPAHVPALVAGGATLIAVVAGVFDADDIVARARAYTEAFAKADETNHRATHLQPQPTP